jgi:alanyl aminopeptidase
VVALTSALVGCPAGTGLWRTAPAPELDGNARLGRAVVPEHYVLDLRIDPSQERFSGESQIAIRVTQATSSIQLHAADMELTRADVLRDGRNVAVSHTSGQNGALVLQLSETLAPGPAELRFAWSGPLPETPYGLYRVRDGDRWYAFTQFEPLEAREAFPSFDQPEFKTPYRTTVRVPPGEVALSNGPVESHTSSEDEEVYVFAETRPLPTYLVAFAVGALDLVGPAEAPGPSTRIVATHGKGALADYALERTPVILEWLTDYFDHPYPFAKLDMVAVPNFGAGAMENVGLVTFRERLLLLDAELAPIRARRSAQSVIAHELAHMWYGNLVTMAWWDDLWLNESFATWMAGKTLASVAPELEPRIDAVLYAQYTMYLDSKRDARQVRQPILDGGDIYNAFDGITYGKGAAVLRMVESWIGDDAFRGGVRAYMRDHAYGSGGTDELLAALEEASQQPVGDTMRWFLDQPGVPLVDVSLACAEGERPSLSLRQTRYLPPGSDAEVGQPWHVPMCVALGAADGARTRHCFVFSDREQRVELPGDTCPVWVHPNDNERGYYHWRMAPERLVAMAREHRDALDVTERVGLPGHYEALVEAEALPVEDHVAALRHLARDERHQVVNAVVSALELLAEVGVGDDASPLAEGFAAASREMLQPQLDRVGPEPLPGESISARLLRVAVLPALADLGRDETVRDQARALADRFVAAPGDVDAEMLDLLLPVAARDGDAPLWEALVAIALVPPSPGVRNTVVRSLGSFADPELLAKSLDLVIEGRLRAQDYRTIARAVRPAQRRVAWRWLESRYSKIVEKLGPMTSTQLPRIASGLCTNADAKNVKAFFASAQGVPRGTERNTRLVLEDIERCYRMRESISPGLTRALAEGP